MAKKITIPYNGKIYTLEFTREVAMGMEKKGFRITEIDNMPFVMITLLLNNAFEANHHAVKDTTRAKIIDSIKGKENRMKLIRTLAEMYADTYNTLFGGDEDEEDEGNPGWEVTE